MKDSFSFNGKLIFFFVSITDTRTQTDRHTKSSVTSVTCIQII